MKNLSLILNAVLLVAVSILYYLHFKNPASVQSSGKAPEPVRGGIVYVNSDSLLDHYVYFKNKKEEFERKNDDIKNELNVESERLKKDAEEYQQKAAGMTGDQRAKIEEKLMERQQSLMKRKDQMLGTLDQEQSKFHDQLYAKLNSYLKEFNKGKNYQFVLGYTSGGGILFANDSLDVTKQVVEGLNKELEEKK